MNGYDGSLLNGLLINPQFKTFFHGSNAGIWAGIVSSMYQIGGVVALPFVGPAIDTWGRRWGMFIGSIIILLGTIISGTTFKDANVGQFMGGRFILGKLFRITLSKVSLTHHRLRCIHRLRCRAHLCRRDVSSCIQR